MNYKDFLIECLPQNMLILVFAVIAAIMLGLSCLFARFIDKDFSENKDRLRKKLYYVTDIVYTFFIAIVSIFPLLGMFGTVQGIVGMSGAEAADDTAGAANFAIALGSTAWGIIFSIIFKLVNAVFQPYIENQIKKAKEFLDI